MSKGAGTLPNDQGQVWREYDITPLHAAASPARIIPSSRSSIGSSARPVTKPGTPIRSACSVRITKRSASITRREMQAVVADIVDRFVNSAGE